MRLQVHDQCPSYNIILVEYLTAAGTIPPPPVPNPRLPLSLDVRLPSNTYYTTNTATSAHRTASKDSTSRGSMNQLSLTLLLMFRTCP